MSRHAIHTPRVVPESATKMEVSKKCQEGHHYSRCMAKYCTCECHKTGH